MSASVSVSTSNVADDRRFMRVALSLGRRGLGRTWPNPAVGAVIVRDEEIVGRGWTQPGGRPHAEIEALRRAGAMARGATLYVTLEPCSHHGKSPPCADAVIASGIARVVSAMDDPNPEVAGRGHARLRSTVQMNPFGTSIAGGNLPHNNAACETAGRMWCSSLPFPRTAKRRAPVENAFPLRVTRYATGCI